MPVWSYYAAFSLKLPKVVDKRDLAIG